MEGFLAGIAAPRHVDWRAPWFAPWAPHGEPAEQAWRAGAPLHDALGTAARVARSTGVRFVPQGALPVGVPYERYIFDSKQCPVRAGYHDFFNGICWLGLPAVKTRLNALQAVEIAAAQSGAPRGAVRDAITVFDENGALLDAPAPLWDALLARDWWRLFVDLRPLWRQARLLVVGHALLEKLLHPRKDLTAHVWHAQCSLSSLPAADTWLVQALSAARLAAKPFTPLPLLGIPGWSSENQNFSFYDDSLVFRPRRPPHNKQNTARTGPRP